MKSGEPAPRRPRSMGLKPAPSSRCSSGSMGTPDHFFLCSQPLEGPDRHPHRPPALTAMAALPMCWIAPTPSARKRAPLAAKGNSMIRPTFLDLAVAPKSLTMGLAALMLAAGAAVAHAPAPATPPTPTLGRGTV